MAGENPYAQFVEQDNPYSQFVGPPTRPPPSLKIGAEGLPDAVKAVWGDFNPLSQAAVGAKAMLLDLPAMRLKQLLSPGGINGPAWMNQQLTPQDQMETQANRALLQDSPMALTGGIGASLLATGGPAAAGYTGISHAVSKVLPSALQFLAPSAGAAGVGGATSFLMNPVLEGESGKSNALTGAATGAALDALTRGASRVVQPITQTPAARKLLDYDITPTPGSAAGGFMKSVEDKMTSWPVLGDIIKGAQQRGRVDLAQAGNKLATPPGEAITSTGSEAITEGKQAFSSAYDKVYGNSQIGVDKQLLQGLNAAKNAPIVPMSSDEARKFDHVVQTQILDRFAGGSTLPTTEAKKVIEANLGKAVFEAPYGSPLQKSLKAVQQSFRDAMARSVGPDAAELPAINQAYSNFADLKKAITTADKTPGPLQGLPTPRQIMSSAKPGELQDLARAANQVMPSTIPNSGTTDRYLMAMLLGLGGAGASKTEAYQSTPGLNELGPAFWLGLGLSPLAYSRAGSRYMMGDFPGQPALSGAMRGSAPYAAQAGALYAPYR